MRSNVRPYRRPVHRFTPDHMLTYTEKMVKHFEEEKRHPVLRAIADIFYEINERYDLPEIGWWVLTIIGAAAILRLFAR